MKIFVTGATGALGPHAVRALTAAGHEVSALARSAAKAALVGELGARPVRVSLFDTAALTAAFAGHDTVANLATAIPGTLTYVFPAAWRENTRIRTEGSAAVVDAAIAAGVGRLVQESIALTYPDRGADWIDESVPIEPFPVVRSMPTTEANARRFTDSGGTGVVLRFGWFYGPGSSQTREMLALARRRVGVVYGRPNGYFSPIHLADAADAVVAALAAPAGVYNVVDDEPVTARAYADAIGAAVGRRAWLRGPGRLAALPGRNMAAVTRSLRVSNRKFKDATGWTPAHPDVRTGWAATVRASEQG